MFGYNGWGQLGLGDFTNRLSAVLLSPPDFELVSEFHLGGLSSFYDTCMMCALCLGRGVVPWCLCM